MKLVDNFLSFDTERLRTVIRAAKVVKEIRVSPETFDLIYEDCNIDFKIYNDAGGLCEKIITFDGIRLTTDTALQLGIVELRL